MIDGLPVRVLGICLALVAAVTSCSVGEANDDPAIGRGLECGPVSVVATLPESLREASGIAADPRREGLFWLHNDGGNETVLFGVDSLGVVLAEVRVLNVVNRDTEDIAIGPCGSDWCAYLGDIGDNRSRQSSVWVYRIPLPDLSDLPDPDGTGMAANEVTELEVSASASWELVYPDKPKDAEGLVIDGRRGQLAIVSKGRRNAGIILYAIDLAQLEQGDTLPRTLRRVGRLAIPTGGSASQLVTAADLSPDGSILAIRSYASLFLLPWDGASNQDTTAVPYSALLLLAFEPQGEGVTWAVGGEVLYLASEGRNGRPPQLSRIRCSSR
ncbi:MAG: hypothetical protein ACWGON_08360 [Gemmatimonadota bacterium]